MNETTVVLFCAGIGAAVIASQFGEKITMLLRYLVRQAGIHRL